MNSEVAIYEYTHLWDNYIRKINPELWAKGKEIFKKTFLRDEVKNDNGKIVLFASTYNMDEERLHSERYKKITPVREQEQNMSLKKTVLFAENGR